MDAKAMTWIGTVLDYCKSNYGNLASVISLILTIVVYVRIKSLQDAYLALGRIPTLNRRLIEQGSVLKTCYQEFDTSKNLTGEEIGRVKATLKSLEKKLSGPERKLTVSLLRKLDTYEAHTGSSKQLWDVYVHLQEVTEAVKNVQEDSQWRKQ